MHSMTPSHNKFTQMYQQSELTILLQEPKYEVVHYLEIYQFCSFSLKYLANVYEVANLSEVYVWNQGKYQDVKYAAIEIYL